MMVALGGMFSERSGIINIALEGIMVIGGLMGMYDKISTTMPTKRNTFTVSGPNS